MAIIYPEHVVPLGAIIVSLKVCEGCGIIFARNNADRRCWKCHSNPFPSEIAASAFEELIAAEHPLPQ